MIIFLNFSITTLLLRVENLKKLRHSSANPVQRWIQSTIKSDEAIQTNAREVVMRVQGSITNF